MACPTLRTSLRIAFYTTLLESILGVIFCGIFVLFYFCAIEVGCPSSDIAKVFYLFYTTYVKETDNGCSNENKTNENPLTQPQMIFFWQVLLLVLHIAWVGAALLLQQAEKRRQSGLPWLLVTALMIAAQIVGASLAATDFGSEYNGQGLGQWVCEEMNGSSPEDANSRKNKATALLILYFLRCGLFIFIHLFTLVSISIGLFKNSTIAKGKTDSTTGLWAGHGPTSKRNQQAKQAQEPELWAPAGPPPQEHFAPPLSRKSSQVQRSADIQELPRAHYQPAIIQTRAGWDRPDGYESSNSNPYQEPTRQPPSSRPRSPPGPDQQPIRHRKPSQKQVEGQSRYRAPSQEHLETQPRYQAPNQEHSEGQGSRHRAPLVGAGTARRPPSFADRLKSAEAGGGGREGPLWGYSNPGVRRQLMERSSQRGERTPDKDVDSAFNFLETYSTKAEEEPDEAAGDGSYSSYLADKVATGIPRARPPPQASGPGARYFVPLKS